MSVDSSLPPPPPRLERWLNFLESVKQEHFHIHHARSIWREVRDGLEANPDYAEPPYLFELMTEWYATSQSVAVRRQSYERSGERTLAQLLQEIEEDKSDVTRDWYRSLYGSDQLLIDVADNAFDHFSGPGASEVSAQWCSGTREDYGAAVEPIKRYVNRRVAHSDEGHVDIPTFSDLDSAIDLLADTLKAVYLLLTGGALLTVDPVMQFDWRSSLRLPWLRE